MTDKVENNLLKEVAEIVAKSEAKTEEAVKSITAIKAELEAVKSENALKDEQIKGLEEKATAFETAKLELQTKFEELPGTLATASKSNDELEL
ncbi:MAG: hypothetical protein LBV51_05435, partial [Acholeplasmatales bacterium]|nr:hypothetical protein [Acholeplasmatales bacterium]